MKYTSKTKEYVIDLALPEEDRWGEVIDKEVKVARKVAKEALKIFKNRVPGFAKPFLKMAFKASRGRYLPEIDAWADGLGISRNDALLLQCTYELAQTGEFLNFTGRRLKIGCTAGIYGSPNLGMFHARTMDWGLNTAGKGTRIFRFVEDDREFVVVGILGLVGALSGMVPGEYSVAINYAPTATLPGFDFGPLFFLREVLETCDSYEEAVEALQGMPLSSNVFFSVCGSEMGQACIIERTRRKAAVRKFKNKPLCHANHYMTRKFSTKNDSWKHAGDDEESLFSSSVERQKCLREELENLGDASYLEEVAAAITEDPVCNDCTHQLMVFAPSTGDMLLGRSRG